MFCLRNCITETNNKQARNSAQVAERKNNMDFRIMRIKKICLTIILICCSMLFFVACKEERFAKSISLNGYSAEKPLEFTIGNFTYNA